MAHLKLMMGQQLGYEEQDIYDYLPHEDAPEMTFDDLREKYDDEDS